jgi:hypothetical protein
MISPRIKKEECSVEFGRISQGKMLRRSVKVKDIVRDCCKLIHEGLRGY